jgi:hypothetical protein
MAQAVRSRPLKAKACVRFEGYVVEQMWKCKFVFSILLFHPVSIIPHTLCTHRHLMFLVSEERMDKAWIFSKGIMG